jgi:hypothetical protein
MSNGNGEERNAMKLKERPGGSGIVGSARAAPSITSSKQIAGLLGPTLVALTASESMNLHIWKTNLAPVTYLNGLFLFVAGLSIVRAHNRWTRTWPVTVTLVGWAVLLGGLFRMFAPEARQGGEDTPTYAVIAAGFACGVFLTIKAYWSSEQNR